MSDIQVNLTTKEVIQGKLLAELDASDKVAIALNQEDLDRLILVFESYLNNNQEASQRDYEFLRGLCELHKQAFGD